jgi:V/A-type H+-transporting ATPase subunit I
MIVEMHRVLLFGPKRLLGGVLDEVQRIGAVHIDRIEAEEGPLASMGVDQAAAAEQAALERLRVRIDGLLALLPEVPEVAASGGAAVPAAIADLEGAAAEIEAAIQGPSRRRAELQEELELINMYEGAVRVLAPLQGALAGSRSLKSVGFILRSKDLTVVTALRNQLGEMTEGRVEVVSRIIEEGKIGVVVAFLHRDAENVQRFLTQAGISELRLPERYGAMGPAEAVKLMEQRMASLPGELDAVRNALTAAARQYRPRLLALRAPVADRLAQLRVLPNLAQSKYAFVVHGWAPAAKMSEMRAALKRRFGDDVIVYDAPADPHDAAQVPVLLDNPPALRPFQRLLGLFRPPRYGTLDPTLYLAIFFPVFVGLVIGDVAYGALLFAFGWWMRNKARTGETWVVPLVGFRLTPAALVDASWIIRVMSVWIILFGALYLEFFGNLLEHHLGWHPTFNRVELTTAFFALTVSLGIVQVMLGYVLHLMLAARHKHAFGVVESLAMICGVLGLLAVLGAMGEQLPQTFFTPGVFLLMAFFVLVLVGVVMQRLALMWLLEAISGMGNVLSYARLFGVGLAAAVLANVANQLGGLVGSIWVGLVVGIFIQMVFVIFTIPGHIIQPARLNWVEFLTKVKYHDETGNSYRPLHKTGGD